MSSNSVDRPLGFQARRAGVSDSSTASEELRLVQPKIMESGSSSSVVIRGESMPFSLDHTPVGRPSAAFGYMAGNKLDGRLFLPETALHCGLYVSQNQTERDKENARSQGWNVDRNGDSMSCGGSDGDEDEDDEDDEEDMIDDDERDDYNRDVNGLTIVEVGNAGKNSSTSSGSVQSSSEKIRYDKLNVEKHHPCFGLSRAVMAKRGNETGVNSGEQQQDCEGGNNCENAMTLVEPELCCNRIFHGYDGTSTPKMALGGDNAYGCSSRREGSLPIYSGESLRGHLSDPITGMLMNDAIILPCGHSFGFGGLQHVHRMKACFICSQPISEDSVRPNIALRAAVQAFLREEESHSSRIFKRRRDRFEMDKSTYDEQLAMDSRSRGVQFPFNISDRVIIKGNKRTPERFVGRMAVVMTQCLNGWYVVKTLDDAESVKLQYRSLVKVPDDSNFSGKRSASSNGL